LEEEAEKYFEEIDRRGGVLACIDQNFFQQEIADAAYRYQQALDSKQRIFVGVNEFINPNEQLEIEILKIDPQVEKEQVEQVRKLQQRNRPGGASAGSRASRNSSAGAGFLFSTFSARPVQIAWYASCKKNSINYRPREVSKMYFPKRVFYFFIENNPLLSDNEERLSRQPVKH